MASNAEEYADSVAGDIDARADMGAPFGWNNRETGETTNEEPEGWREDEDTPWDVADASEYLEGALDIQYLVNSDRTYRSARILIAFGGPNAWIDTRTGQLEVSWWSAPEYREIPAVFIDGLDDYLSEMWEMGA